MICQKRITKNKVCGKPTDFTMGATRKEVCKEHMVDFMKDINSNQQTIKKVEEVI